MAIKRYGIRIPYPMKGCYRVSALINICMGLVFLRRPFFWWNYGMSTKGVGTDPKCLREKLGLVCLLYQFLFLCVFLVFLRTKKIAGMKRWTLENKSICWLVLTKLETRAQTTFSEWQIWKVSNRTVAIETFRSLSLSPHSSRFRSLTAVPLVHDPYFMNCPNFCRGLSTHSYLPNIEGCTFHHPKVMIRQGVLSEMLTALTFPVFKKGFNHSYAKPLLLKWGSKRRRKKLIKKCSFPRFFALFRDPEEEVIQQL